MSTSGASTPTPPGSTSPSTPPTLSDEHAQALAAVLSAEQAAVFAYGVVGAQGAAADQDDALDDLQRHAARRDHVAARLSLAQRTPQPAPPGYTLPFPVTSPARARALAVHVESAVSDANADLVAATPPNGRVEPGRWLAESAQAAWRWGARDQTFPGMPERSTP